MRECVLADSQAMACGASGTIRPDDILGAYRPVAMLARCVTDRHTILVLSDGGSFRGQAQFHRRVFFDRRCEQRFVDVLATKCHRLGRPAVE